MAVLACNMLSLGPEFWQVLDQCGRDPKHLVNTHDLWEKLELFPYSFSLNLVTVFCIIFEETRWHASHDNLIIFVFNDQMHPQNIFYKIRSLYFFFYFIIIVSKYGAKERWEEMLSAFKCKVKARVNQKPRIWCKYGSYMYGVWGEKALILEEQSQIFGSIHYLLM